MPAEAATLKSDSRVAWLNGTIVPLAEARVSVLDRGFLFGDGVYEVIGVYDGQPFMLGAHLDRLQRSLDGVRIRNPHTRAQWSDIAGQVIEANGGGNLHLYLQVTRGPAPIRDHPFPEIVEPTVLVMASAARPIPAESVKDGVAGVILEDIRWGQCNIKSTMLLANVLLRQKARDADAEEAILVRTGLLTEGATSNVFIVDDNGVATPPNSDELLPGITRDFVLNLCRQHQVDCRESPITEAELRSAAEIWITSSGKEILAVTTLDGKPVGDGQPGPVFRRVYHWFQENIHGK